jgi:hypothetical protein
LDPDTAFGGLVPMEPSDVFIPEPTPLGAPIQLEPVQPQHTGLPPLEMVVEQEGPPEFDQLQLLNDTLFNANPNPQLTFAPHWYPFNFCIRSIKVKRWWGCDRRVVQDTWYHCWEWVLRHHVRLTKVMHRVWLWGLSVDSFRYQRWCYVVGQPPTYVSYDSTRIRFLRVCYRVFCPRPNVIRIKVDQIIISGENDEGGLWLVTTENDAANLPAPGILAGIDPDPLQIGSSGLNGVLVQDIIDPQEEAAEAQTMVGGAPGVFEVDMNLNPGDMTDQPLLGPQDLADALNNNHLQLYCGTLDNNGVLAVDSFTDPGTGLNLQLQSSLTSAIPVFVPPNGAVVSDPTPMSMELSIPDDTDFNDDDINNYEDWATFNSKWLQGIGPMP